MKEQQPKINMYVHGSIAEYQNDGDPFDRYYLPVRSLASTDPEGVYILPDTEKLRTYASQLDEIHQELNIKSSRRRVIFVPDSDYLLDVAINEHIGVLENELSQGNHYQVEPYVTTKPLLDWVEKLQKKGHNVSVAMPERTYYEDLQDPSNRSGWGRNVKNPEKISFAEKNDLPYPVAYVGQGWEETLQAYRLTAKDSGNTTVFFKPVFSSGGFTLKAIHNEQELKQHYDQIKSQGALDILGAETPIEMQALIPDMKGMYSIQYENEEIVSPGGLTEQIVKGTQWQGNILRPNVSKDLVDQANNIFEKFKNGVKDYNGEPLKGHGGIDFGLVTENGKDKLVIIEHNGRRVTGPRSAMALAERFGIDGPFVTEKTHGEPNCDLKTLWGVMKEMGLQFDPMTRMGVYPIVFMEGSGMLMAAAPTSQEAQKMLAKINNALKKRGYLS